MPSSCWLCCSYFPPPLSITMESLVVDNCSKCNRSLPVDCHTSGCVDWLLERSKSVEVANVVKLILKTCGMQGSSCNDWQGFSVLVQSDCYSVKGTLAFCFASLPSLQVFVILSCYGSGSGQILSVDKSSTVVLLVLGLGDEDDPAPRLPNTGLPLAPKEPFLCSLCALSSFSFSCCTFPVLLGGPKGITFQVLPRFPWPFPRPPFLSVLSQCLSQIFLSVVCLSSSLSVLPAQER